MLFEYIAQLHRYWEWNNMNFIDIDWFYISIIFLYSLFIPRVYCLRIFGSQVLGALIEFFEVYYAEQLRCILTSVSASYNMASDGLGVCCLSLLFLSSQICREIPARRTVHPTSSIFGEFQDCLYDVPILISSSFFDIGLLLC